MYILHTFLGVYVWVCRAVRRVYDNKSVFLVIRFILYCKVLKEVIVFV